MNRMGTLKARHPEKWRQSNSGIVVLSGIETAVDGLIWVACRLYRTHRGKLWRFWDGVAAQTIDNFGMCTRCITPPFFFSAGVQK